MRVNLGSVFTGVGALVAFLAAAALAFSGVNSWIPLSVIGALLGVASIWIRRGL